MIVKKTSDWSNSDCFVHVEYRQRYIRVRDNIVINVYIELWSRLPCWRHYITSDWCVFEWVNATEAT